MTVHGNIMESLTAVSGFEYPFFYQKLSFGIELLKRGAP